MDPDKKPTLRDVAQATGLSLACCSLSLRNSPKIPETTRARVQQAAGEMGYAQDAQVSQLMGYLRQKRKARYSGNLGFLHFHPDKDVYEWWFPDRLIIKGAAEQALALGYKLEPIWAGDPQLSTRRLLGILKTRGIQGLVALHRPFSKRRPGLPWNEWCCAEIGVHELEFSLPAVIPDYFQCGYLLGEELHAAGYRCPGLILANDETTRVNRLVTAGFRTALAEKGVTWFPVFHVDNITQAERLEAARQVLQNTEWDSLVAWVTDPLETIHQLSDSNRRMGMATFDAYGTWAGLNRHYDQLGCSAVNVVVDRLNRNQPGLPEVPEVRMLEPSWVPGPSLPPVE